ERTFSGKYENGQITVTQPQIFGFAGSLTPKSPNPIRSLAWGPDAAFEGDSTPNDKKALELAYRQDALAARVRGLYAERVREIRSQAENASQSVRNEIAQLANQQRAQLNVEAQQVAAEHLSAVSDGAKKSGSFDIQSLLRVDEN